MKNSNPTVWAVIAGGGTAGHVHPALAVAEEFVRRGRTKSELHFIGSSRGLEAQLVPEHGFELTALPGRGIQRKLTVANLRSAAALGQAAVTSWRTLRRLKPRVLVSVGGYASLPAVVGAVLARVPIVVMEQNTVPGAANRVAGRFAKVCVVSFADTDLPKAIHTGNPSRHEILVVDRTKRDEALARLGVEPGRHLIAAFGGSLGAKRINQSVVDAASELAHRSDLAIRHVIGDRDWATYGGLRFDGPLQYQPVRFERAMHDIYQAADFVLSRAGATSVAEIAETGTPAILVPLPGAPGDHQTRNAKALTDDGAAIFVLDQDLDGRWLTTMIDELIGDPRRLESMSARARQKARPDAAAAIADLVERHARPR